MSLQQNLIDFRQSVTECKSYIDFAHKVYANGNYKINADLRKFISQSAFLKIFIAWETFLEQSFLDYLMGEPSVLNNRPAKWATPRDKSHANQLLVGTQKYVDWANPDITKKLSDIYFHQGYVFNSQLSAIRTELLDLRTIRNSAAHLSSSTSSKLDGLSSRLLSRQCNNYTAYKLLFSVDPNTQNGNLILDNYLTLLDVSAEIIANG